MTFSTALITGASGFIGRALTKELRHQGKRVIAVGRRGSILPDAERVIELATPRPEALAEALQGEQVDLVFHCAAYGVAPGDRNRAAMFEANVAGTGAWVEASAAIGARAFVYLGSCSEYGCAADNRRIPEDHPLAAEDLYGASKAAGGQWGRALARDRGLNFSWVRLFGVFGPGEAAHRLIPYLYARLRKGEQVDLTPGQQWRDLLYVEDAVAGLLQIGTLALEGRLGVSNLCTGEPVAIRAVAEEVARQMGMPLDLLKFGARPYRPGEQMWMVGDPSLLQQAGFRSSISLAKGVESTLRALDQLDDAPILR